MRKIQRVLVTGGAGFIGSALCRYLVNEKGVAVCNVDALTYAGVPASLREIEQSDLYRFEQFSVCDAERMRTLLDEFNPDTVMHLAAESHVDRLLMGMIRLYRRISWVHIRCSKRCEGIGEPFLTKSKLILDFITFLPMRSMVP